MSDDSDDEYSTELPEWLVNENNHYNEINVVINFKNYIKAEPLFIGIDYISAYDIQTLIHQKNKSKSTNLEKNDTILFDDLYKTLFGKIGTKEEYEAVTDGIINKCYVSPHYN